MLSSSLDGCDQHPARETMMRLVVVATPARQFIYFEHYFDDAGCCVFAALTAATDATAIGYSLRLGSWMTSMSELSSYVLTTARQAQNY